MAGWGGVIKLESISMVQVAGLILAEMVLILLKYAHTMLNPIKTY